MRSAFHIERKVFDESVCEEILDLLKNCLNGNIRTIEKTVENYKNGINRSYDINMDKSILPDNSILVDRIVFNNSRLQSVLMNLFDANKNFGLDLFHYTIAFKYPGCPGVKWHQDYDYWRKMGIDKDDIISMCIALEPQDVENGCMRILDDFHKENLHHVPNYDDKSMILEVDESRAKDVILNTGDVSFWHSTAIHSAHDNLSDRSRVCILAAIKNGNVGFKL